MTLFHTLSCLGEEKVEKKCSKMCANRLNEIAELVVKYLRNELTEDEEVRLKHWREESDRHEEEFIRLCSEDFLQEQRRQELSFSFSEAKERFQAEIRKSASKRIIRRWSQIAAVVVVLLGGAWLFFRGEQTIPEVSEHIVCGGSMARLMLGNGEVVELDGKTTQIAEQKGVELNIAGGQLQYIDKGGTGVEVYNTLEIPRRGEYKVTLADGTQVWLNSETVLRYPQTFSGDKRNVYLSGEAYFEVAPNKEKPFIVHLKNQEKIEVLGTSFNIHAYEDEHEVYTTLVKGCVNMQANQQQLALFPGERAVWSRVKSSLVKEKVDTHLYTAWKDGRFVFRRERLEEVMSTVARWYDVKVIYENEKVKNFSFSGNIERYDDFDKIITMLEMTRMVNFKIEKNNIFIYEVK